MKPLLVPVQTDAQRYGTKSALHRTGSAERNLIWQDPLPQPLYQPTQEDIINLKAAIAASGLSISEMVSVPGHLRLLSAAAISVAALTARVWH